MKRVWEGMNLMSGCKSKGTTDLEGDRTYANDLNKCYTQFDCNGFGKEREDRLSLLPEKIKNRDESERIQVSENEVLRNLRNMKAGKALGPDSVLPSVLKSCANELSKILCELFNASLQECVVPTVWKMSSKIPVPKKQNISSMNDLRPIALTSCVMKVFERCVLFHLNKKVLDYILINLPINLKKGLRMQSHMFYTISILISTCLGQL